MARVGQFGPRFLRTDHAGHGEGGEFAEINVRQLALENSPRRIALPRLKLLARPPRISSRGAAQRLDGAGTRFATDRYMISITSRRVRLIRLPQSRGKTRPSQEGPSNLPKTCSSHRCGDPRNRWNFPRLSFFTTGSVYGCLVISALAHIGCAVPQAQEADLQKEKESPKPVVLSDRAEEYLENVFLFGCARAYIPYPEGEGPPVPERTQAEWADREAQLTDCMRTRAEKYTTLERIRMMTWNGERHSMTVAEMRAIVQLGDAFLENYVRDLLDRERQRAEQSSAHTSD